MMNAFRFQSLREGLPLQPAKPGRRMRPFPLLSVVSVDMNQNESDDIILIVKGRLC